MLIAALLALAALEPDGPACAPGEHRPPETIVIISSVQPHYCFDYRWPREASAIPALESQLRARAAEAEAWLARQLDEYRAERLADDPGAELPPFSYGGGYGLSADTDALLTMEGTTETYTGGAHGGMTHSVLYWDKAAGREIGFADLFDDPAAAYALIEEPFCTELRLQREARAGGTEDDLWGCPALPEQPIMLFAPQGGQIRTLIALLAPYVAGAWAEGPYYVEMAVTPELVRLLKPAYRDAFAAEP